MSANIKNLRTFISNRLIDLNFQGNKLVNLHGAKENKDKVLYILEKFLARDFGSYYDSFEGLSDTDVNSTLQFINGLATYNESRLVIRGTIPCFHCIRYSKGDMIRSFIMSSDSSVDYLGINMTVFSSVISDNKWSRLVFLLNELVGYEFIKLDLRKRKLSFDIHDYEDWSEEAIKFVYLLVSESMLTPDNYTRVTLLSEVGILSSKQVTKLVKTLSSISRNELIIVSNDLDVSTLGFNHRVLNMSV